MTPLIFNSTPIRDRDDMLCLTDMWKAAGSPSGRAPNDWRVLPHVVEFVEHVAPIAGKSGNELFRVVRGGRAPGTWAHWQIGLAYAKYLSPEFHAWANSVVKRHMEGRTSDAIRPLIREQARQQRNAYTATLSQHGVSQPLDYRRCTNALYTQLFGGTADRLRTQRGLKPKANVRDNLSAVELGQCLLAEALSVERIEETRAWGGRECADATALSARAIYHAVETDRASRRALPAPTEGGAA